MKSTRGVVANVETNGVSPDLDRMTKGVFTETVSSVKAILKDR